MRPPAGDAFRAGALNVVLARIPAVFLAAFLAGVLGLGLATGPAEAAVPAHLVAGFPRGTVVLETAGPRCLLLEVYFAATAEQRAQGLMFVEGMPEFEGMYFGYNTPAEIIMWMKNTVLPLDMLFIRSDGTIGHIARDAKPYSTERIDSGGPVVGVLEVNAGFARRWGVDTGTRLLLLQ
ncbi:MAG: DUF192 domain-containing protein [Gammaproteobacteria bacterium]